MERKPKEVRDYVPTATRLKRSDLRRLVEILSSDGTAEVAIETDEFKTLSTDELVSLNDPITEIKLARIIPEIVIGIQARSVFIVGSSDELAAGIAARIKQFLTDRKLVRTLTFPPLFYFLLFLLACTALALRSHRVASALVSIIGSLIIFIGLFISKTGLPGEAHGPIRFQPEVRPPVNWRALVWDITKILIGAIVGSSITLLSTRFRK